MPIYSYRCESCGHAKDVLQKVSDPLLTQCPACGADAFRKQLTAAGFQLKGSGWYVTDFKGGNAPAAAKADGAGTPASTGAAAESKPADATSAAAGTPAPAPAAATPAAPAASKPAAASGSGQ